MRSILGALLVQERDRVIEAHVAVAGRRTCKVVTKRAADRGRMAGAALRLARVRAREVEHRDLHRRRSARCAIGAGQMSRVDAVKVAVDEGRRLEAATRRSLQGSVAASDAFFPFRDGLDAVAAAGATAVVQPGGSVRTPK